MPIQVFVAELKRRRVFRVAAAYAVVGWLIIQFATTVFPHLSLPDWAARLVVLMVLLGFPVALLLSWALELTPDGMRLTHAVDQESDRHVPAMHWGWKRHALAYVVVALLGGLAVFGFHRWWQPAGTASKAVASGLANPSVARVPAPAYKSIAVLPFVNMSEDKANEHFGDGLSEELLNLLAKVPDLHVAARTSSFSFKGKDATIADVAKALHVDAVLEGSVRRSGNTVRVVAQLISAKDGTHLWSEKYDREMSDIFAVQDDIADNIIKALRPHLMATGPAASSASSGGISAVLFEKFLRGRGRFYGEDEASMKLAHEDFLAITNEAPDYAPGHAWLARTWLSLTDQPDRVALKAAQGQVDAAMKLDPREPMAHLVQGNIHERRDDADAALASFDRALAINPVLVDAHIDRQGLLASIGRGEEAVAVLETARRIDPLHPGVLYNLAHLLNLQGRRKEAFATVSQLRAVTDTAAKDLELHLYSDNWELARGAFVASQYLEEDPDSESLSGWLYGFYLRLGLHQELIDSDDDRRYVALAQLSRRGEAEAAAAKALSATEDPVRQAGIRHALRLALRDHKGAKHALLALWRLNATKKIGNHFTRDQAIALIALLKRDRDETLVVQLTEVLEKSMAEMSPLHSANVQHTRLHLALFQGRNDDAATELDVLANTGFPGNWQLGTPFTLMWLFEAEPRFQPALRRIEANHATQLAELDRLRQSGMNIAQARADYLARIDSRKRAR